MTTAVIKERLRNFPRGELIARGATIRGEHDEYRYNLIRVWDQDLRPCTFIMLNPSTADGTVDDATIRKCMRFAFLWGYGSINVVNLFAWRATSPRELRTPGIDPVGPQNNDFITAAVTDAAAVVCAWGSEPFAQRRGREVAERLAKTAQLGLSPTPQALQISTGGAPWHPLYVPYTVQRCYF